MGTKQDEIAASIGSSPISSTVDKLWESWYFWLMLIQHYHDSHAFRYNLNAFIQALRNVTFMLQSEPNKPKAFDDWYRQTQEQMRTDITLRGFVKARNTVVKREMLAVASSAEVGLFRGRRLKLATTGKLDPFLHSNVLLARASVYFTGLFVDKDHRDLNEQLGVRREWKVLEISDNEIATACADALRKVEAVVRAASELWGVPLDVKLDEPNIEGHRVLLESDLDPSLPAKWGWT